MARRSPTARANAVSKASVSAKIRMQGAESRTANENSAYVFLKFNTCLSLLFPILVSSLVLYVVLALIFSILFNIIFSLYEVVVLFCICRFRTSFLSFLSGVVFVLCLSLFSVNFPSFNQYLLLPSLLLYVESHSFRVSIDNSKRLFTKNRSYRRTRIRFKFGAQEGQTTALLIHFSH